MDMEFAIGSAIAVITVGALIVIIHKLNRKNVKGHFDERQELARGRAYKYSSFTFMILILVYLFINELGLFDSLPMTHGCAAIVIFFAGIMVYALYCIRHDAYLGVGTDMRSYRTVMWIVIACNAFTLISKIMDGELTESGKVPFSSGTYLMFVIVFSGIMISLQARDRRLRKEEADEES